MALDAKMIPSMQVDFSISQSRKDSERNRGQVQGIWYVQGGSPSMEASCYPRGMYDHQWMDVPDGIAIVLVPLHKFQMVCVSLLL
jgi:hypothetical protein